MKIKEYAKRLRANYGRADVWIPLCPGWEIMVMKDGKVRDPIWWELKVEKGYARRNGYAFGAGLAELGDRKVE